MRDNSSVEYLESPASDVQHQRTRISYTMQEAAHATGLSLSSIKSLVATERLRAVRVGRRVLIPAVALDRLLAAN